MAGPEPADLGARAFQLLVRMVGEADLDRTRAGFALVDAGVIPTLVSRARAHGVESWLAAVRPSDSGPWQEVAEQRTALLGARARAGWTRAELGRVLSGGDIRWALIKGESIALRAYPRPDLRHSVDVDALVGPDQFERAVELLTSAGFTLLDQNWPLLADRRPGELRLLSANGVLVDLHWSLLHDQRLRSAFRLDSEDLLSRLDSSGSIPMLDPNDQFVHAALHATLAGANRLQWFVDLDWLARTPQHNWASVHERARQSRAELALSVALTRAERALGRPIAPPAATRSSLARRSLVSVIGRRRLADDPMVPDIARLTAKSVRSTTLSSCVELLRRSSIWAAAKLRRAPIDPADAWPEAFTDVPDSVARARYFATGR